MKSTVDQIRARFDADVERFSNLETGQSATIDSPLCLELIASAATSVTPHAHDLLDIGCGAGNYTLKLLEKLTPPVTTPNVTRPSCPHPPEVTRPSCPHPPEVTRASCPPPDEVTRASCPPPINCTLIDLSQPMLTRALQRIRPKTTGTLTPLQGDMREIPFPTASTDIIVTAATFHHLRADDQWRLMFQKCFAALRPGGSLWIFDFLDHSHPAVEALMRNRYSDYLIALKGGGPAGEAYRDHVFAYIAQEDTPKPLIFQLDLLKTTGFTHIDILHKNALFSAFGATKP